MKLETIPAIYKAVYSNVEVLEMMVNGVAVMRRTKDSYLNATQILKVAGFDKGKRTKILEREVLIGEHTKVQGGYGKYQGTWIPEDKGRQLAERYNVLEAILPILDIDMATVNEEGENSSFPSKDRALATIRRQQAQEPPHFASSSQTPPPPSPIFSISSPFSTSSVYGISSPSASSTAHFNSPRPTKEKRPRDEKTYPRKRQHIQRPTDEDRSQQVVDNERDRSILMSLFLSDDSLLTPRVFDEHPMTADFNIDLAIDDQGHTALHWAASLARLRTLEMLLSQGADVCKPNYAGETALMRSVMMTHNHDNDCFDIVLDALSDSIDKKDHRLRTLFHHIVLSSAIEGQRSAAIYYMEHLLSYVAGHERHQAILSCKDECEDTAFTIAGRLGDQQLIDLLAQYADGKVPKTNRSISKTNSTKMLRRIGHTHSSTKIEHTSNDTAAAAIPGRPGGFIKQSSEIMSVVQNMLRTLEDEYAARLRERNDELERTRRHVQTLTSNLEDVQKKLRDHQKEAEELTNARLTIRKLESALLAGDKTQQQQEQEQQQQEQEHTIEDKLGPGDLQTPPKSQRESQLEQKARHLQLQLDAYREHREEMENRHAQALKSNSQCKRLIAACCNIPVDKVDDLIESLTAAIQSDPLDVDIDQVIGFMEKMRHMQKADSQRCSTTNHNDTCIR